MLEPIRVRVAPARRGGFTLLDMVLTVAIIATMAAVAVPRYGQSVARYRADLAARRIVADLDLIRMRARAQGTYESATFYTSSDYYRMISGVDLDDILNEYSVYLAKAPYHADIVEAEFRYGTRNYMRYGNYGQPYWGGYVVIRVGDVQKKILVDEDTGRAYVE